MLTTEGNKMPMDPLDVVCVWCLWMRVSVRHLAGPPRSQRTFASLLPSDRIFPGLGTGLLEWLTGDKYSVLSRVGECRDSGTGEKLLWRWRW